MRYRLLGPLEVAGDGGGTIALGPRERVVLATLVLSSNRPVSASRLIDALWGDEPPRGASNALQVHISKLRKKLAAAGAVGVLEAVPGGYLVRTTPGDVDLDRFVELVRGRDGVAAETSARLSEALSLFRGPALCDADSESLRGERARLDEERLTALERRIEADVALGRHRQVVAELEALVHAQPFREGPLRLLMIALYRSGRQADALGAYKAAQERFREELGIDPSRSLQDLEVAILRQDPSLGPEAEEPTPAVPIPPPADPEREAAGASARPPTRTEQRKTVTVLFSDVTDSTGLGERVDPETMRRVLARFFDVARAVVERHGGTVEKFIGDAVMAVFGVPLLHEDDALRAVRAAAGLHSALAELNVVLRRDYGVALEVRSGVNTGEVVTGTDERLVTGDAVTTAARLEQAAAPGEVLIGARTFTLVRDRVEAVPVEPLAVRGKAEPVCAYRVVSIPRKVSDLPVRRRVPLVGRHRELRTLRDAFERVVRERSCGLLTLLGAAGIGKTRLTEEFLAEVDATVVRGRCLPYGEGITYFPVVEILEPMIGTDPKGRVAALLSEDKTVSAGVEALTGELSAAVSSNEIAWAVRKILECVADRPLVAVFDDLHWGQPTLFDLIEHVTDLSRSAPIFLVCLARPELFERRPGWGGGKLNASTLLLEPLADDETDTLIDEHLDPSDMLAGALRARVRNAAGGNPLFVEEMLAFVSEGTSQDIAVPPTIQALLSARLDQLDPAERDVLECGSIEGLSFHTSAVRALSREHTPVTGHVLALVRKDLIRPDRPTLPGEDAFRFRHILIRDAAYERLPKSVRAELHEHFAEWLAAKAPALVELDEILGYHLEQTVRYRGQLGPLDAPTKATAETASKHLEAAGRRALDRGDVSAALNLLERATALVPESFDVTLELTIAIALRVAGRLQDAIDRASATAEHASALSDRRGRLRARLVEAESAALLHPADGFAEMSAWIEQARDEFAADDDDVALAYLWSAVGQIEAYRCRRVAQRDARERAAAHAARAGLHYLERRNRLSAAYAIVKGPTSVEAGIRAIDELQRRASTHEPAFDLFKAVLLGISGRTDDAHVLCTRATEALLDRGELLAVADCHMNAWYIETAARDLAAAEDVIRLACEELERIGDRSGLSTSACYRAASLYARGAYRTADDWARKGAELASPDDVVTQHCALQVQAKVAARSGDHSRAKVLAAEAVRIADETDQSLHRGAAWFDLAEVHDLAADTGAAIRCARTAGTLYAGKGATAFVHQVDRWIAERLT